MNRRLDPRYDTKNPSIIWDKQFTSWSAYVWYFSNYNSRSSKNSLDPFLNPKDLANSHTFSRDKLCSSPLISGSILLNKTKF